jgi:hypothetical protein
MGTVSLIKSLAKACQPQEQALKPPLSIKFKSQ